MTRVFIHKQDIQILETDFFLVGAGNDFTTDFQAYITPSTTSSSTASTPYPQKTASKSNTTGMKSPTHKKCCRRR